MPKKPHMRTAVYNSLLEYFKNRYEDSQSFRIRRGKDDDRKFPTVESIVDFVFEKEQLFETNTGSEPDPGQISISRGTVRKAVNLLIEENKIALFHKSYEYVPHMENSLKYHPTLEIADKIDISIGIPNDIIVLSVAPEYATSVTNYLSALFYKGDIVFIPIAGNILCISVLPQSVVDDPSLMKISSSVGLRERIEMAIHQFNYKYPTFPYGVNYEFAYHVSHNPSVVGIITKEARKASDGRTYHSAGSIVRSIQEGASLMAEQNDELPPLRFNPETGIEGDEEPLGEPNQDEWGFMDDGLI